MRKLMFSKLLSGVLVIAGFALFIFVGKHVFATTNATGGAGQSDKGRSVQICHFCRITREERRLST